MHKIVYEKIAKHFKEKGIHPYNGPVCSVPRAEEEGAHLKPPVFATMADPKYWEWFLNHDPKDIDKMIELYRKVQLIMRSNHG